MQVLDGFALKGQVKWVKRAAYTKSGRKAYGRGRILAESPWMENKIVSSDARGISIILDRLTGTNTYTLNISHADIGDDNTAPAEADTDLGNGLVRASLGAVSRSGKTATFRFFYPDATTPDDTYLEFGMFIDGTSSVGAGRLFNHLLFTTDLVKSTGEDHTVVCKVTGSV